MISRLLLSVSLLVASRSAFDGVFSKPQAMRGQAGYREQCSKCHGENLAGGEGAPGIVGADFITKWKSKSAGDLFDLIQKTMPVDDPGNLSRRQCADITAYILSMNDYPAGDKDMDSSAASLADISLDRKK